MRRPLSLFGFALMLGAVAAPPSSVEPLRVTTRATPGPYYPGQAIEIRVEVEGASGQYIIEPPRSVVAEVRPMARNEAKPTEARFLVLPRSAGTLDVPPFRVRSGDQTGSSRSIRLTIASLPPEGRTSSFLGGVGSFDTRAEAEPSSLQAGQTLEFRIRLSGPAAWGSVRPPDLGEWSTLTPRFRVEPLPSTLEATDPPVRTFRYRLRPTRSGRVVLPPVLISSFDPKARRYSTRATSGVSVQVEELPRFNPKHLDYGPIEATDKARSHHLLIGMGAGLGIVLVVATIGFVWKKIRDARRADPRRLILELIRGLHASEDKVEMARKITEAVAFLLHRFEGRASGVLTPPEARLGIEQMTDDPDLARRTETLIGRCDRVRFGEGDEESVRLVVEGREILERIAERMPKEGKPREAVETAGQ